MVGVAVRLVEEGMQPGDITILKVVDGFGGRTQIEDAFMSFFLELGAVFVSDRFWREVVELADVAVEELPLVRTEVKEWYAWQTPGTYYDLQSLRVVNCRASPWALVSANRVLTQSGRSLFPSSL